ncbi:MAG TPA: TolC family protein [Planctomycetota bacterium]|nr:TolC family protein [Planctomycetota bacterium]
MTRRPRAYWVLALGLAAGPFLAGCALPRRPRERVARSDIEATAARYRPDEGKTPLAEELRATKAELETRTVARVRPPRPPLPQLTSASGLADLIHYALLNNPSVEAAFYGWKAAVEMITTKRSLPDPMLQLNAEIMKGLQSFTPALMTQPGKMWSDAIKLGLRGDAAYEASVAKRSAFEGAMLATALGVKRTWYQLWTLQEQLRWTREALGVVDEIEKLARERLAVGKVTQQDVLRAQMERDRLRNQIANLEDSRKPIVARLRTALGMAPEEPLADLKPQLTPTPPDFTEQSLLDTAFVRNPRLKAARSEVLQAIALFHLAHRSTVPNYGFGLGAKIPTGGGMAKASTAWMPSVSFSLPIWRDKIAAEIAAGRAQVGAARAKLSAEELDLAMRFAEVAFLWREADRNAALFGERLLPKAKAALNSARAGYITGVSTFLDLLEAEKTLLGIQVEHAVAQGQREVVLAEMSLVILGLWPEGIPEILPPDEKGTSQ